MTFAGAPAWYARHTANGKLAAAIAAAVPAARRSAAPVIRSRTAMPTRYAPAAIASWSPE